MNQVLEIGSTRDQLGEQAMALICSVRLFCFVFFSEIKSAQGSYLGPLAVQGEDDG